MLAVLLSSALAAPQIAPTTFKACVEEGLSETCRKRVDRFVKWNPEQADVATYRLAVSLLAHGDDHGAVLAMDSLVPDPSAPSAWSWGAATIWYEAGRYADAAAAYDSILTRPEYWWGFYDDAVAMSSVAWEKASQQEEPAPVTDEEVCFVC